MPISVYSLAVFPFVRVMVSPVACHMETYSLSSSTAQQLHNEVLFLDELPECDRKVLDVLREPLESDVVNISRAARQAEFPAQFQLVVAMNSSPTGSLNVGRCSSEQVTNHGESSQVVRQRVIKAYAIQQARAGKTNALLSSKEVQQYCDLLKEDQQFLQHAVEQLGLSLRTYHRVLKVARTIADLANQPNIHKQHLAEALNYRAFDRMLTQLTNN